VTSKGLVLALAVFAGSGTIGGGVSLMQTPKEDLQRVEHAIASLTAKVDELVSTTNKMQVTQETQREYWRSMREQVSDHEQRLRILEKRAR
jgi:hypothetical protein